MRGLNNRRGRSTPAITIAFVFTMIMFGSGRSQGVTRSLSIGIVDTRAILTSLPDGRSLLELYQQRDDELGPLVDEVTKLRVTVTDGVATPQEQERYVLLQQTVKAVDARWAKAIEDVGAPLETRVDRAISVVAERLGLLVILDGRVAQQVGLIVYAHPKTNVTAQVIAELARPD